MTMKRKLLIALLATGAFGGFAVGFTQLGAHHRHPRDHHKQAIVQMCVDAALQARAEAPAPATPEPAQTATPTPIDPAR